MRHELTMANINLYAVLRNLEDLCQLDHEMTELIKGKKISIQISVKNGPKGLIRFENGKCQFLRGKGKSNIKLYFKSPKHFNDMIDGNANPIPLKGITKLGFLTKEFVQMTDRLTYYLKPTDKLLADPKYAEINTVLTAYTAFFALAEIGNHDPIGKHNAKRIDNGVISVGIENGPVISLTSQDGYLIANKGFNKNHRASMYFTDMKTANELLNGKIDSYSCIASQKLKLKGYIPMLDNMNKLLGLVPKYL